MRGQKIKIGTEIRSLGKVNSTFLLHFFKFIPYCVLQEDTLRSELMIPQDVSNELESLLFRMLDKDPSTRLTMKELLAHEWITQEIINNFDFASIVPCDEIEAHPEIYFTPGQVFSTTSHDSLSLVDDESICDDIDEDFNEDISAARSISTRSKTGNIPTLNYTFGESPQCDSNRKILIANGSNSSLFSPTTTNPPNLSMISIELPSGNTLTTSKSENNIFEKNNLTLPYAGNFDVVSSLSDLSDDSFYDRRYMNDLSKTTVLNRVSDDEETVVRKKCSNY
jgi:serine/threonine protein kinase